VRDRRAWRLFLLPFGDYKQRREGGILLELQFLDTAILRPVNEEGSYRIIKETPLV